MNILLVVASGKSSRFGGFPKAFCQIGKMSNVENTIKKSENVVDKVYVGVNRETHARFYEKINGCEMFSITTGQGDAHSLLKCIKYIKEREGKVDNLLVCWGDAVFRSSLPFEEIICKDDDVVVACAVDKKPYAWFDVDSNNCILKAHFAKDEGTVEEGLHDQSLFKFDMGFALEYLDEYRKELGILENNDENLSDVNEMKLLYSFEFLMKKNHLVKCVEITKDQVLSFNTREELNTVISILENS